MNRSALFEAELNDAYIYLVTLRAGGETVRVTNYGEDVSSGGRLYMAQAFEIRPPASGDDAASRGTMRIDNASLTFMVAIRSVTDLLTAEIRLVTASTPDVLELAPLDFECRLARYDGASVDLDLTYEPILDMGVPHHTFTPALAPALFG